MKRFAALRFSEDKNIAGRIYWYFAPFPVEGGERVLAPIGTHNRLQAAVVERTLVCAEAEAPYDLRLMKRIAGRPGARKLLADGAEYLEYGGVKYDEKRYTPFGKLLLVRELPDRRDEILAYGVTDFVTETDEEEICERILGASGGVVLSSEAGRKVFSDLLELARGRSGALLQAGIDGERAALLREKLT